MSFARDTTVGYLEQEAHLAGEKSALAEVVDSAHEVKEVERRRARARGADLRDHARPRARPAARALRRRPGPLRAARRATSWRPAPARSWPASAFPWRTSTSPPCDFSGGWQMRHLALQAAATPPGPAAAARRAHQPPRPRERALARAVPRGLRRRRPSRLPRPRVHGRLRLPRRRGREPPPRHLRVATTAPTSGSAEGQPRADARQARAAQEREIAHMQVFVDKFRYKPTKAAQAQERMRRIEQIRSELVILPEGTKKVHFSFPEPPPHGRRGREHGGRGQVLRREPRLLGRGPQALPAATTWRSPAPTARASPRS